MNIDKKNYVGKCYHNISEKKFVVFLFEFTNFVELEIDTGFQETLFLVYLLIKEKYIIPSKSKALQY